jgi:hypothetical protein
MRGNGITAAVGGRGEFSIKANNEHVREYLNSSVHRPRTANNTPPKERLNSIDIKNKAG